MAAITEAFLHAADVAAGVRAAARRMIEDYGLPVRLELWTAPADGAQPAKHAEFRFVAVDAQGDIIDLD